MGPRAYLGFFAVKSTIFSAKNYRRGLGPIETCNSCPKVAVLYAKTTNEG